MRNLFFVLFVLIFTGVGYANIIPLMLNKKRDFSAGEDAIIRYNLSSSDQFPIKYVLLKTSCGCVRASITSSSETNGTLDSTLNVFLNTVGKSGTVEEKVIVDYVSNYKTNQLIVPISINVNPSISFVNYNKISLGSISESGSYEIYSKLYNKNIDLNKTYLSKPAWLNTSLFLQDNTITLKVNWNLLKFTDYGVLNDQIIINPVLKNGTKLEPVSVFVEAYRDSIIDSDSNFIYFSSKSSGSAVNISKPTDVIITEIKPTTQNISIQFSKNIMYASCTEYTNKLINGKIFICYMQKNSPIIKRFIIPYIIL